MEAVPASSVRLITEPAEMLRIVRNIRAAGRRVGLVPTMGALHGGHLSLVRASVGRCDATVATIFVNPTQFGPNEDFDRYPRTMEADLAALAAEKTDFVFAPAREAMYPEGYSTYVEPPAVARRLEGRCRPGHFRGVATVVLKLFHLVPADAAFFGQKDYQQALVIRRMVEDLNVPVEIEVCPTVREADGLAMSSRNVYLSPQERVQALALYRSLSTAAEMVEAGERDAARILARMRQVFAAAAIERIDYLTLAEPDTLEEVRRIEGPVIALVAAWVGKTRLIDNLRIG